MACVQVRKKKRKEEWDGCVCCEIYPSSALRVEMREYEGRKSDGWKDGRRMEGRWNVHAHRLFFSFLLIPFFFLKKTPFDSTCEMIRLKFRKSDTNHIISVLMKMRWNTKAHKNSFVDDIDYHSIPIGLIIRNLRPVPFKYEFLLCRENLKPDTHFETLHTVTDMLIISFSLPTS